MNDPTCDIVFAEEGWAKLYAHLFPGDGDEHGAVLRAGVVRDSERLRLIVRDVVPAVAGSDYVAGQIGYRALQPSFIHRQITACRDQGLAYLAVHNHDCDDRVAFSRIDMASHERGYPALLDIGNGIPVGALVLGRRSIEADIWTPDGQRRTLSEAKVIGPTLQRFYPRPPVQPHFSDLMRYDRQVRMFGKSGQALLARARVAVIGLGGVGSIVSEHLARLGVGRILAIDPDRIEPSNLSRVVGATSADATARAFKTDIAHRHAVEASDTMVERIADDVALESVARRLRMCDYVFLAADSMRARLVFNALVHQYFVPGVQLGAKIRGDGSGHLLDAMSAVRPVRPGQGCLWCNQLIDPKQLAIEAKSDEDRRAQAYGVEEPNPSVITLNAVTAAHAVNDFLFYYLALSQNADSLTYRHFHYLDQSIRRVVPRRDDFCRECGEDGRYGRGDAKQLPCLAG